MGSKDFPKGLETPEERVRDVHTRPGSGRGDFRKNMDWVMLHRLEYVGKWVALKDGELVASDTTLEALHRFLLTRPDHKDLLVLRVGQW